MDNIFEKSVNKILNAIDTSSMFQNLQPKLAVKISSLVNEDVLVLISIISLADRLSRSSEGIESVNSMTLTKSNKKLVRKFHAFFCKHDVTFSNLLNNNIDKTIINCLIEQNLISTIEFNCISKYWTRLLRIFHYAHLKNVHVMIDGEQSYFQHGINGISLNLMEIFNKGEPFSCDDLIIQDIKYSKEKNFTFAVKLVRGAYMNKENKRCNKLKIPSPFQNSYEETSNCFQNCTDICIENMNKLDNGLHVMFATHNEESILYAIEQMKKIDTSLQENISFGQLMGMCDYITLTLAKENYKTYKYIPFGLVDEVMPYLIRRIQENSDVLKNVGKEITMIKSELQRRTIYRLSTQKLFKSDGI
ncbi:Carbapenem antibiotics biosynthesis protein CarD [Intoshia linei]|uniref:Proline dehydrogenase n=1 Tax=Intoshia linei TaxID=1819745 RepID=A0A177AVY1_9BILA|nr:Carbapenem antibiotics biosynthesis protein CarD [Intoshia linei]